MIKRGKQIITNSLIIISYQCLCYFEGLSGDKFRFDKNGDGPARYNIIHFKQTEPGVYKWIRVGKYLEGVLHLNMSSKLPLQRIQENILNLLLL